MTASSIKYNRIAPVYDVLDSAYEFTWRRPLRRQVFKGLSGRVLDAGVGTGRNMPFYPRGSTVTAIDNSPKMLVYARKRAEKLNLSVDVREADLLKLPFEDGSFDSVAITFVLCVLPEEHQLAALKELRRVLRPNGTLRILDYTLSSKPAMRTLMRIVSPWMSWIFAASYTRRTLDYVQPAGLELVSDSYLVSDVVRLTELRRPVEQ